jgi:hypothetical protein
MVTLKTRLGGTQPTGWTVWALPPWFEVQQTVLSSSSGSSKTKASVPVKDVCMPPRPAGASNDQNVWMWDYSIGQDVAAVAIQPDENLVAVAVQPWVLRAHLIACHPQLLTHQHHRSILQRQRQGQVDL